MEEPAEQINQLIQSANKILIIQPDNPDGDSMGSSLALEQILTLLGKDTEIVCGTTIPSYLRYIPGWDRVEHYQNFNFDLSIIVDTSSVSLLDNLAKQLNLSLIRSRPCIVIDHHQSEASIDFARVRLNIADASATAEVIYELAKTLNWENTATGRNAIAAAILSDSQGLTANNTSARTVHIIGELVESGVSLSALENARRDTMRKSPELVHYKGELLQRIEYFSDDRIAILVIPWEEIERYSPAYNPSMLAIEDMRLTTNTAVAIALKVYKEGKITGKIRSNYGMPIAAKLAEHFGGGGHEYASGFKLTIATDLDQLKRDIVNYAMELLPK